MSENEWLIESASRLRDWLNDPSPADSDVVREVLAAIPPRHLKLAERFSADERLSVAAILLERSVSLSRRSFHEGIAAGRLAVTFARAYDGPDDEQRSRALLIEADAWRENAWSLMQLGDYGDAMHAAEEAAFSYSLLLNDDPEDASDDPDALHGSVLAHYLTAIWRFHQTQSRVQPLQNYQQLAVENAARLGLTVGELMHHLGKSEEGLAIMERSCEVLLHFLGRKDRYVRARTLHAKLLGELQRWSEALAVFESTAALAAETDDLEVQAFLLGNIGACYYYLGNPAKAKVCAETAMRMFEDLEQHIDAIRPRTLLVLLLMEEGQQSRGKYSAAAAELFKSRAAWLAAGMRNEAAEVMVQIIRALILAERAQDINWPEMIRTFSEAGLADEAMKVLRNLSDVAARRALLLSDAEDAADTLARVAPTANAIEKTG